jgi:hypothetical protein
MPTMNRMQQLTAVQKEATELFRKKNADYGDAFAMYGTVGVLVRLGDKIQRLQSITKTGVQLVDDEKLRDTLIDLHNYAAMGIMLLDETNQDDDVQLEDNVAVHEWSVNGSSGNKYMRKRVIHADGSIIHSCSCPSFAYCKTKPPGCKHIKP